MEHEFWHERWAKKEIGFHEGTVNQYLHDHWPELAGKGTDAVFVPLCGKAHDMWWLHDRGHPIIGVELSELACKDFFEEAGEKAKVHPGEPFITFKHDNLQLWCGDFFQLVPEDLKHVRLVYDRAALIALPPHMRRDYVNHLTAIIPDGTRILLITLAVGDIINTNNFGRRRTAQLFPAGIRRFILTTTMLLLLPLIAFFFLIASVSVH